MQPLNPQSDNNNVFSAPEDATGAVPKFFAPNGRPLSTTQSYKLPDLRTISQLPSVDQIERGRMNQIVDAYNRRSGQIRQQINLLQQQLDGLKSGQPAPDGTASSALNAAGVASDKQQSEMKQLIDSLKQQIADNQAETFSTLYLMLNGAQRRDYDAMRHGALVVEPINRMPVAPGTGRDTDDKSSRVASSGKGSWLKRLFHRSDR